MLENEMLWSAFTAFGYQNVNSFCILIITSTTSSVFLSY